MAETSPEAAASAPSAGPPYVWADVEPAQKKQKLGGQRMKWVGELAFVQKGPQDKTVYCGYTHMGLDMKEKAHCWLQRANAKSMALPLPLSRFAACI